MARSTSITRFPAITNPTGLTVQEMSAFPSIFAKAAHPKMSKRYTFLSTADVLEPLLKAGYVVTHAAQRATRFGHRDPKFTRHMVRIRKLSDKPVVGDCFPEVQLMNSHDGQSRFLMHGEILRLACLNGMAWSTLEFKGVSIFHKGELEPMLEQIKEGVNQAAGAVKFIKAMMATILTDTQAKRFAAAAAKLAYDNIDFDTSVLLASRREIDNGNDLWRTYNRVQENIVRGGVSIQHTTGQARAVSTRGITHLRRELDLNLDLWQLASRAAA